MTQPIRIDPEFAALIPPISVEERAQLEASILAEGCRDALVLWNGTLIDGHNRYAICTRLGLPFRTASAPDRIKTREDAADWIDRNQLGRRNLTPDAFRLLLGRRYNRTKKAANDGGKGSPRVADNLSTTTAEALATQHGVDERTVRRDGKFAEDVAKDPELADAVRRRVPTIQVRRKQKERNREAKRQANAEKAASAADPLKVGARFSTLLIDPPWDVADEGDVNQLGRAKADYATMPLADLLKLPVGQLADNDAHLYLWITNRSLPKGFALLDAWGFRYITNLVWPKASFGMGQYFRGQHELILFGVSGSMPIKRKDASTILPAWGRGAGGHSSKPQEIYEFVESCSPGPYLEMFARSKRSGWFAWGADA